MYGRSPNFSATYVADFHGFKFNPRLRFDEDCGYGNHTQGKIKRILWQSNHTPALRELTTPLINCLDILYDRSTGIYKSLVPEGSRLQKERVLLSGGRIALPGEKILDVISLEDILAFDLSNQPVA